MSAMSDASTTSPAKKKLKQSSIMESLSKAGFTKSSSVGLRLANADCTIDMEPECDDIMLTQQSLTSIATLEETTVVASAEVVSIIEQESPEDKHGMGKPLSKMYSLFNPACKELQKIEPGRAHLVLFKVPTRNGMIPEPFPARYCDKWDSEHVKMPCSPSNLYPINLNGNSSLDQRWKLIREAYSKNITNSLELEKAILSYNSRYNHIWNLKGFHEFLDQVLPTREKERFFHYILPGIIRLAMEVPERVTQPPVLLVRHKSQSVSISQSQIASLLANAFLSTFPRRNTQKRQSEFSTYPDINFIKLFENKAKASWVYEKIKCLLHYFDRVITKEPNGVVTFTRRIVNDSEFPNWDTASEILGGLYVSSRGTIENEGVGLLQMDFANRFIGGGVLNTGCVQEEIRFVICPELLVSCLFSEAMENNEALIITGCEQYCQHSGYGDTFKFEGDFVDQTPRDGYGRRLCQLVAIDATLFHRKEMQYKKEFITRELQKAYAGFYSSQRGTPLTAVATGNWGCGAFRGDPRLKCLIQLMAAAVTKRDVVYFTFGDKQLRGDIFSMYSLLTEKKVNVGNLFTMLCQYEKQIEGSRSLDLYGYLYALLDTLDSDGVADCSSNTNSFIESDSNDGDIEKDKDKL